MPFPSIAREEEERKEGYDEEEVEEVFTSFIVGISLPNSSYCLKMSSSRGFL